MDNLDLELFKKEVKQEVENNLKNSELNKIITKYGLSEDVIEIPVIINLDKIKDSSIANLEGQLQLTLFACCWFNGQYICK